MLKSTDYLRDAGWPAFWQAICKGIEGRDWEELYDHCKEMSRAAGVMKPNESQNAKALWKMMDNILGRNKTRLGTVGRAPQRPDCAAGYHAARNLFERFRGFLELISRFEFEFCRPGIFFFLNDSNFWCVHVNVPWPVCAHAFPFRMLWRP